MNNTHVILLYSDQELQAIQRQRDISINRGIFHLLILAVIAIMIIRFVIKIIIIMLRNKKIKK
jgi:hypothetical protein